MSCGAQQRGGEVGHYTLKGNTQQQQTNMGTENGRWVGQSYMQPHIHPPTRSPLYLQHEQHELQAVVLLDEAQERLHGHLTVHDTHEHVKVVHGTE